MEIIDRNTNTLAPRVYKLFESLGVKESSRNGPVLRIPDPVTIVLTHPWERVNVCPARDANPYFHFMEAMAMLAPFNSVSFLSHFAKPIAQFSDDGETFNAFYGTRAFCRWHDQVEEVIGRLAANPKDRQTVVMLWDPQDNLMFTKDKACNLMMLFSVDTNGRVRMTTYNRSNDAVLGGVSGANIVHFSYFHEFVAQALGRAMGEWWHTSNNLHVYTDSPVWERVRERAQSRISNDPYSIRDLQRRSLFTNGGEGSRNFRQALSRTLACLDSCIRDGDNEIFFQETKEPHLDKNLIPMFNSWVMHKRKAPEMAKSYASAIEDPAWRLACTAWLERRYNNPTI
jgi:hypothetical protein